MAQGMRQRTLLLRPKMCGNELEKEGAAWTAGYAYLPMLSESVKPKMALTCDVVTHFWIFTMFGYMCLYSRE